MVTLSILFPQLFQFMEGHKRLSGLFAGNPPAMFRVMLIIHGNYVINTSHFSLLDLCLIYQCFIRVVAICRAQDAHVFSHLLAG